ncbi:unnamed protein product [Urochloa decumbens]|uniref:Bifunctional inhibitor/plant lipid transfer protein/seed storage helical domain-containing protein n=1 Tax=Urochloa decumbens TaxID=240449 RepID=A0ABC9FRE0_9POAL
MASSKALPVAAVAIVVLLVVAAAAPAAEAVCGISKDQFMSCQPVAADTPDPPPPPSNSCCDALGAADLECLCGYKNSPWLRIYNVDPDRAMQLPAKCGLATPPNC